MKKNKLVVNDIVKLQGNFCRVLDCTETSVYVENVFSRDRFYYTMLGSVETIDPIKEAKAQVSKLKKDSALLLDPQRFAVLEWLLDRA
jgi:hypothetical protein